MSSSLQEGKPYDDLNQKLKIKTDSDWSGAVYQTYVGGFYSGDTVLWTVWTYRPVIAILLQFLILITLER